MNFKLLFIFHFSFFIFHSSLVKAEVGPDKKYFLVNDFKNNWLVYDNNYQNYVPYIADIHSTQTAVSTLIEIESNRKYYLLLYTTKDSYLFINASMNEHLRGGTWRVMSIDSLYQKFKKTHLLLTFYGSEGVEGKSVFIAHKKGTVTEKLITVEADESFLNLRLRSFIPFSDFLTIAFLIMATLAAFLYVSYPRVFSRFVNLQDLITLDVKERTVIVDRPMSRIYLLFIVLLSLELAYLYFFVTSKNFTVQGVSILIGSERSLIADIWLYAQISAIIFVAFFFKYFIIYLFSQMYRLEASVNIHYFKVIQSSFIYYSFIVVLLSIIGIYKVDMELSLLPLLLIPSVIFYLIRGLLLYFSINKNNPTKNLYLISYLCIAELIPLLIGIRYLF